jgi:hypothetical protein
MRLIILCVVAAFAFTAQAGASQTVNGSASATVAKGEQHAGYKVCRKVGSAYVCN